MYSRCTIQFIDDGTIWDDQIIKATNDVVEDEDDLVFFYGLSTDELRDICRKRTVCEGEWIVLYVSGPYDTI